MATLERLLSLTRGLSTSGNRSRKKYARTGRGREDGRFNDYCLVDIRSLIPCGMIMTSFPFLYIHTLLTFALL
jgi:hypothetical protein